tara:strand:+ start:100 stop:1752 length:1653 start_codon:yes stop_codon:yes gene_type:complete
MITAPYKNKASIPGTTGVGNISPGLAANPLAGAAKGLEQISGQLAAAGERVQKRNDIISSAVASDNFNQEILKSYNTTLQQGNMLDPNQNTIQNFNIENEQRISNIVSQFSGSDNARAALEANLRGTAGQYADKMIQVQNNEQKEFILDIGRKEIAPIAAALTKNPGKLREAFDQVDAIAERLAPTLSPIAERKFRDAGRSAVMESAVTGLLDGGKYEEASDLLLNNSVLMKYLEPSKRDQFNRRISTFRQTRDKSKNEMSFRQNIVNSFIEKGMKIDSNKAMNYVIGADLSPEDGPSQKISKTLLALGIKEEDASMELKAEILGVNLAKTEKTDDPNKDYSVGPNGKSLLTVQGAFKRVKPYLETAVLMQSKIGTIESAHKGYEGGNQLEGLTVLTTYLKMIDDGAVVRESDIAIAEKSSPIYAEIAKAISRFNSDGAQAVSPILVQNALLAARSFVKRELEVSKSFFDGYQKETGFSNANLGLPGATYDEIYKDVRTIKPIVKSKETDETGSPVATDGSQPVPTGGAKPRVYDFKTGENGKIVRTGSN